MRHLVIPDTQIKYGEDLSFLTCIGEFIVQKKPDVIIHLGDFADMTSLSSYDVGKKSLRLWLISTYLKRKIKRNNINQDSFSPWGITNRELNVPLTTIQNLKD